MRHWLAVRHVLELLQYGLHLLVLGGDGADLCILRLNHPHVPRSSGRTWFR
jgi:hypothetical protein